MTQIYDITPPISPNLAVFPGDTPPTRQVLLDLNKGDNLTLSTLNTTVHLGAHVDGPNHYGKDARSIDRQPLDLYLGPCQVMTVTVERGNNITINDLPAEVKTERLLLHTGSYPNPEHWNDDFAGLDPALVDHLSEKGVRLVGIDTPSVDPATSKDLAAHHRFLASDMAILEGIVLTEVPDGPYELIALPLKLEGYDASPVRAILRSL